MDGPERNSIAKSIRDIIVVGGMLGLINWLAARTDFGWLEFNPTPWLLLPVLIGMRHGASYGITSGALAGLLVAAVQSGRNPAEMREFIQDHPFYFTALVLAGLLAGETQRALRSENSRLCAQIRTLTGDMDRSRAELELVREARQQLQGHLALHNASLACIDDDLRKVITGPAESLMERLVALLHQHGGVTSAAIYRRTGEQLRRIAALNPTGPLSPELHLDRVPIARRAFADRAMVSVKDPLETTPAQPFLAALPFEDAVGEGVLLVQDMPLSAFNWPHLARLEMILLWTSSLQIARAQAKGEKQLVDAETFQVLIGNALATESAHHLPSVILKAQGGESEAVRKLLLKLLPGLATATVLPNDGGLAVLLPFAGEADATALGREMQKSTSGIRVSNYLVGGGASAANFWAHLIKP